MSTSLTRKALSLLKTTRSKDRSEVLGAKKESEVIVKKSKKTLRVDATALRKLRMDETRKRTLAVQMKRKKMETERSSVERQIEERKGRKEGVLQANLEYFAKMRVGDDEKNWQRVIAEKELQRQNKVVEYRLTRGRKE